MRPAGGPPIRFAASLLIVLLLATGLGLGGYGALLALRREPVPSTEPPTAPAAPEAIPAAARLPADDEFAQLQLAPTAGEVPAAGFVVAIRVQNLPAGWHGNAAGVAVHDPAMQHGLLWLPLAGGSRSGEEMVLSARLPREGTFRLALAAEPSLALHGYLVRTTQDIVAGQDIALDATAAAVEFVAADRRTPSGPWRLVRRSDPAWLPMADASTGLHVTPAAPVRLWLGAGDYALEDPMARHPPLAFAVPADRRVVVTAGPPPAPGAPR